MNKISFEVLKDQHLPLLLKWLETSHVKAWWNPEITWSLKLIKEKFGIYIQSNAKSAKVKTSTVPAVYAYIIYYDSTPIGYIQYYDKHDFMEHDVDEINNLPSKCAAIDWYIGETDFIGKGIGTKALELFLDKFIFSHFNHVLVDPNTENKASIRVYEKLNFKIAKKFKDKNILWMIKNKFEENNKSLTSISRYSSPYFNWGKDCEGWWLKQEGNFSVIYETMPEGTAEKKHVHQNTEQFFYVLDGELTIEFDSKNFILQKNQFITVPSNIVHQVINHSSQPVNFLIISCPNDLSDRIDLK